jgi:uncharacterized lipoprotein YbaY
METKLVTKNAMLVLAFLAACFATVFQSSAAQVAPDTKSSSKTTATPSPTPAGSSPLAGTSWQLVKIQSSDEKTSMPDDKSKYTITFEADGLVSARLDCNRGSGTWKSEGPNQVRFGPIMMTRMLCPPGSLDTRIARDFDAIRTFTMKEGRLFLSLLADGGIYEFEPLSQNTTQEEQARVTGSVTYRQRIALSPDAVVEVKLLDVSRADARAKMIAEQIIKPAGRQVPIDFVVPYDPQRINPRGRYVIRVRILEGNSLRFTNTQLYPVITSGHPSSVTVVVKPTRS